MRVHVSKVFEAGKRLGWSIANMDHEHYAEVTGATVTFAFQTRAIRGLQTFSRDQVMDLARVAGLINGVRADLDRTSSWSWDPSALDAGIRDNQPFTIEEPQPQHAVDGLVQRFLLHGGLGRLCAVDFSLPSGLDCLIERSRIIIGTPWSVDQLRGYATSGVGPHPQCTRVDEADLKFIAEGAALMRCGHLPIETAP